MAYELGQMMEYHGGSSSSNMLRRLVLNFAQESGYKGCLSKSCHELYHRAPPLRSF